MHGSDKLNSRDLINIGIFTAIICVITMIVMPIGFFPVLMPLYCVFIPLLSGIPYMLFVTKVKKLGMVTIMSVLLGIFLLCTGMGIYAIPVAMITGLISDILLRVGHYSSLKMSVISCGVFSIWCFASFIPLIFLAESFWEQNAAYGEEFINTAKEIFHLWMAPVLVLCCMVFGMLGAFFGSHLLKKHFVKSGIV